MLLQIRPVSGACRLVKCISALNIGVEELIMAFKIYPHFLISPVSEWKFVFPYRVHFQYPNRQLLTVSIRLSAHAHITETLRHIYVTLLHSQQNVYFIRFSFIYCLIFIKNVVIMLIFKLLFILENIQYVLLFCELNSFTCSCCCFVLRRRK